MKTQAPTIGHPGEPARDGGAEPPALDLLIHGYQLSRMIRLAADLDIAGGIAPDESLHVDDLALGCGVLPHPLLRMLRALAAFGIFRVSADGMVAHSPHSLLLRRDVPNSRYHAARFWTAPGSWLAWNSLDAALAGGTPQQVAWGIGRFDYLRDHQDEARIFDAFMAHTPDERLEALAAAYDFSDASLIADIGGGNGAALRRILNRHPAARGLIFDRRHVVEAVPPEALLAGRIAVEAGDFFERVPEGADVYLLNWVLHDWSDEDCRRILGSCRAAMRADARLLIGERLLDPDPAVGDPAGYLVDTHMLVMHGAAHERTEAEFRELLAASGLVLRRSIATASPVSIVEAVPQ